MDDFDLEHVQELITDLGDVLGESDTDPRDGCLALTLLLVSALRVHGGMTDARALAYFKDALKLTTVDLAESILSRESSK